jgi:hypothetical protein
MPSYAFGEVEKIGLQNKADDVMVVIRRRPRTGKPLDWTDSEKVDRPALLGHNRPVRTSICRCGMAVKMALGERGSVSFRRKDIPGRQRTTPRERFYPG